MSPLPPPSHRSLRSRPISSRSGLPLHSLPALRSPTDSPLRERGMALVIVLSMLVLIAILVVGLLQRAGTDRTTAAGYMTTSSSRQLADTVVNLVQGQINQATTQTNTAWASQPGAIRTYTNNAGSTSTNLYRLYSSTNLTISNATSNNILTDDLPPAAWASSPAQWVDLNAPVNNADGGTNYPILDTRSVTLTNTNGFAITSAPGSTATQPAPMPVQWLYVLQNGQIVAPTTPTGTSVTITAAAKTNPIVGRIAFWTDDESCKVNINTAAAGTNTFWDTPRFYYSDESTNSGGALASYQPTQGEYQRYPGHPATISMNNILNGLGLSLTTPNIYSLTPRYTYGGSSDASISVTTATNIPLATSRLYPSVAEMLFTTNSRTASLMNTTDAATRQRAESARFFLTPHSRAPEVNLFGQPRVAIWPISSNTISTYRTPIDSLIAFDSTLNANSATPLPYYFQRIDNTSPTTDVSIPRNQVLLNYLDTLMRTNIPGFPSGNFLTKYGADQRQILTEIFDYVRMINLRDPSTTSGFKDYADSNATTPGTPTVNPGAGQVIPTVNPTISGTPWANVQGFGRMYRIAEADLLLVGMGQGTVDTNTGVQPTGCTNTNAFAIQVTNAGIAYTQFGTQTGNWLSNNPALLIPQTNNTAVQAFFLLNFFDPAQGYSQNNPGFTVQVSGLQSFSLGGQSLGMPASNNAAIYVGGTRAGSGTTPFYPYKQFYDSANSIGGSMDFRVIACFRVLGTNGMQTNSPPQQFPFYSSIVSLTNSSAANTNLLSAANLTINVYAGNSTNATNLIQTYQMNFPATTVPLPLVEPAAFASATNYDHRLFGNSPTAYYSTNIVTYGWAGINGPIDRAACATAGVGPETEYLVNPICDTIVGMIPTNAYADYRLLAQSNIPATAFTQSPLVTNAYGRLMAYGIRLGTTYTMLQGTNGYLGRVPEGNLVVTNSAYPKSPYYPDIVPVSVPNGVFFTNAGVSRPGDWDNGVASYSDAPYINKTDEGNMYTQSGGTPYFGSSTYSYTSIGAALFSPNRQVPSPGVFGSLSTGVLALKPWQTLLFRPGPPSHPGSADPKDHLLLDLFWMPVAEPYAISEMFSTAGKVNLNYQILPFTYITRNTALMAVLASEKVAAVDANQAYVYKHTTNTGTARSFLNLTETLSQFQTNFAAGNIYQSASQICDLYLVPSNTTLSSFTNSATNSTGWYGTPYALVGDNVRERPYTDIYPRVTTKSNVFTIYYTVQTLKNASPTPTTWNETSGKILGEYRGSTTIERFLDPGAAIPDFATNTALTLEPYYKWRIIENHQFAP